MDDSSELTSYRSYYLLSDISRVQAVIILFQIPNLLFVGSDYAHWGMSRSFFFLLALRSFILIASLLVYWLLGKYPRVNYYDWLVLSWGILIGAYILIVDSSRPPEYMLYTLVDMAMLVCYYLLLPNRYPLRVIPPLLFTIGCLLLLIGFKNPPTQLDLNAILIFYLVNNLLFYLAAKRIYSLRRQQYQAVVSEKEMAKQLYLLAITDELTGIHNRREIFNLGEREVERYHRYGRAFTVLMIDIDYFKRINDTYGHRIGDEVLVSFCNYIKSNMRVEDMFGRVGGEEFVLILPETAIEGALNSINRLGIGKGIIEISIKEQELELTVSIGITESIPGDSNFEDILYRADEGLYQAKEGGRNRVVVVNGRGA